MGSYSELSNLVHRGPRYSPQVTVPMKTTLLAWRQVTNYLTEEGTISPHTPLWGKPCLQHLRSVPDPQVWARFQITKIKHIISAGQLLSLTELKRQFHLPPWMYFRYIRLRHAIKAQFPAGIVLAVHSVESLLTAEGIDRTLSSIYVRLTCREVMNTVKLFEAWQKDIPALTEEDWSRAYSNVFRL